MADPVITAKDPEVRYDDPTERRSDLLAAFDAVEAKTATPAKEVKAAVVPVTEEALPAEAVQDALPEDQADKPAVEAKPEPATSELAPPKNWKKADKDEFAVLPDEAKKIVLRREKERDADYTRKTMEVADFRKEYGQVDQLFAPYKQMMQANGYTPSQLVHSWMSVEQELMAGGERAARVVQEVAKNYKIDLGKLATPETAVTVPEQNPEQAELERILGPIVTPLRQQVESLQGKLTQYEQGQRSQEQMQQQARITSVVNQIQSFAAQKDSEGELMHPYFGDVEQLMGIMATGYKNVGQSVPPLEELYQQAVQANPSTREKFYSAQQQAAETKRLTEARAKSAQAKRAGSSVTGAPGLATPKSNGRDPSNVSVRDALMAAVEEHQLQ